ncbi:hypothetical protein ABPG72_006910 [Tetrahymena utriculariae]
MKTCPKHKLPALSVCLSIDCKKQRMMCYKCLPDHILHSEQIVQLENLDDKNNLDCQENINSSISSNKNNKQGVSPHNTNSEFNGSPFMLNNLANLKINSSSQDPSDQNVKKSSAKNSFCKVKEFNEITNSEDEFLHLGQNEQGKQKSISLLDKPEKKIQFIENSNSSTQSRKQEFRDVFVIKEESFDDENINCKIENSAKTILKNTNPKPKSGKRFSKQSAQTKVFGSDVLSQVSIQKASSSQKNINQLLSQASTVSPSIQRVDQCMKDITPNNSNYYPQYPYFPPRNPYENPFQFSKNFHPNPQIPYPHPHPQAYPSNQVNNPFSHVYNQQYNFSNMPPYSTHNPSSYIPSFHNNYYQNHIFYEQESKESYHSMPDSNSSEKYFQEKDKLNNDRTLQKNQMKNEKLNFISSDESLQQQEPTANDFFLNGSLSELIKQNENVQKICLYLRTLNDIKMSVCAKIERMKNSFLQQIQMKEEDFSYAFLANTFTQNNYPVEQKLKNYFEKIQHLNSFFEKNKLSYNPQAASKQKLGQIEQELDRMLSYSIEKIDQETLNQTRLLKQEQVDPFRENSEYEELIQFYQSQPANIDAIKDKINFYTQYKLEFDGTSKGNPGRSGAGFIIKDSYTDNKLLEYSVEVGTKTINQSEYLALIYGMYTCYKLGIRQLTIQGDSEVVIKHMLGVYQCRSQQLRQYYNLAKVLDEIFYFKDYIQVKKELNSEADALANQALN